METPSSTRRVTRSQTIAAMNNSNSSVSISKKIKDSTEKGKPRKCGSNSDNQQDRSALIDITNDSPIVGVAKGSSETPFTKQKSKRMKVMKTPGSGEALLRGQVKALLQKVEEEAEVSKISFENCPFLHLQGFVNSPTGLLAPTPANTPQIPNLSGDAVTDDKIASFTPLPVIEEQLKICQVASKLFDGEKQGSVESQKSLTRSLLLDFSEKSEVCDSSSSELSSGVTTEEDSASKWSLEVNASSHDEDDETKDDEEEEDGWLIDELCEGIGKIDMNNESMAAAKFEGKHIKFEYNSDDDIEEEKSSKVCSSPSILHLKGLPTPKGKHLRFPVEQEEDDD